MPIAAPVFQYGQGLFVTTGFLGKDVKTPGSSLGVFLRERFPRTLELQVEHKTRAGMLLVPSADLSSSSTIGAGIECQRVGSVALPGTSSRCLRLLRV